MKETSEQFKDLRGVACPMNFVKTKLALDKMEAGQILKIFLDDGEPQESVSTSLREDGHEILEMERAPEGHWSLTIRKV